MKKQMRVLVAAATIAIGMSSSITHAAFVNYEFINEVNSDGRLTGTFEFDDVNNLFGAVDLQVAFDEGHVGTFGAQNGPIAGSAGGDVGRHAYEFRDGIGSQVTNTVGYFDTLYIGDIALQFTTPISGTSGFLDWSATHEVWVEGSGIHKLVEFDNVQYDIVGSTSIIINADPKGVRRTAFRVAAVPEPSTYAMMAIGLLGIASMRRRQNKA